MRKCRNPIGWAAAVVLEATLGLNVVCFQTSAFPQQPSRTARGGRQPAVGSVLISVNDSEVSPSVFAELNILIDGAPPPANTIRVIPEEKQILIGDVPVGECRLVAVHRLVAKDEVRIRVQPGQQAQYSLKLKPALVRLTVICEPGSRVYVNARYYAEVPAAGRTGILEFPPGEAALECVHEEFKPKAFKGQFAPGDQEVELPLERIAFSGDFSDGFGECTRFWNAPASWRCENGGLKVAGEGTGLLRDRIYKDFRAQFVLALENQKGVAWVIRARDESNGYLFQLTGPAGNPPSLLRSFIRQDGNTRLLKSDPVIDDLSQPGATLEVHIDATAETIKHFIKASRGAGEPEPLSVLTDKIFRTGTLGFATVDSEEFRVYFVHVQPKN